MPTRLAGWVCVLTALAAGSTFAADKPKEKKDKPANPTRIPEPNLPPISLPAASPRNADSKFVVAKPVGTWVRETTGGTYRLVLGITDDRLSLTIEPKLSPNNGSVRLDADYAINKESCLFGVIDSFEAEKTDAVSKQQVPGQPFSVRFRVEGDALTLKEFKGLGVGIGPFTDREAELLALVCGKYTSAEAKQKELLNQSEGPAPTPLRIHGGILKADPPKEGESRFDRVPLPTPHYLKHYPTYIAPDPAFPLQKERDEPLDPTGEIRRSAFVTPAVIATSGVCTPSTPATSAYAGPIGGAVPTPSRSDAVVVQAKSEVSTVETPRLIPPLREDDCPKCDDPPTDAEVMQRFNAKRQKDASFEVPQDDIVIVKNLVTNKIDAPRFYPLVGLARTHCCQWECGVYYRDLKAGKPKVEVISFETNNMRMTVPAGDTRIPQRMLEK